MSAAGPEGGNRLKRKLAAGEAVLSMTVRMAGGPEIGRLAAAAGYDSLYVDLEHSALSLETTALVCTVAREAGVTPLVRVPAVDAALIGRLLDCGAQGIIAAQVTGADDARRLVAAARHPPAGNRSSASLLPALQFRKLAPAQARAELERETFLAVMIESTQAVAAAAGIAAVEGIDMLFVGAVDLAAHAGWDGDVEARVEATFDTVLAACRPLGRHVGAGGLAQQPALLRRLLAKGVRYLSAGTDVGFLLQGATQQAELLRAARGAGC